MSESLGVIRVKQLPEKSELNVSDYMIAEDNADTWKVKVSTFNAYIQDQIDQLDESILLKLNDKLSEIQIMVNKVEEMIIGLDEKMDSFAEAEAIRVKNENDRKISETIRSDSHKDMVIKENKRQTDETQRQADEVLRKQAYDAAILLDAQLKADEAIRKTNEINRGVEEGKRQTFELQRKTDEAVRKSSHDTRVLEFNDMKNYYNSVCDSLNKFNNCGMTTNGDTTHIVATDFFEVMLPNTTTVESYEALIHIACITPDTTKEGLIGLEVQFNKRSDGYITSPTVVLTFPKRYPFLKLEQFSATLSESSPDINKRLGIRLSYKETGGYASFKVKGSIVWNNISMFKTTKISVFSRMPSSTSFATQFTIGNNVTIKASTDKNNSYPRGFIEILDAIKRETEEIVSNIKPFKSFPVGSIYQTTSTKNPNELLGGGTWVLLYGAGIQDNVEVDGTKRYSPTIYSWERQS